MKICKKCKEEKREDEFRKGRTQCKLCIKAYNKSYHKIWRNKNKKILKEYKRKYYIENKEEVLLKCKKYRKENKEQISNYKKNYYSKNKDPIREHKKKYYEKNKGVILEKCKGYYKENSDNIKIRTSVYYKNNREKLLVVRNKYYINNKDLILIKNKQRLKERLMNDSEFRSYYKIYSSVSELVRRALIKEGSKKEGSCLKKLPYSINKLRDHLENQFESWMNWENYGTYEVETWDDNNQSTWKWNIDHIIPQSKLIYTSMEDKNFKKCWSLKNLRPLSAKENIKKGNKLNGNTSASEAKNIK